MMGDGVSATGIPEIPYYDEDLDEAFNGPEEYDEADENES